MATWKSILKRENHKISLSSIFFLILEKIKLYLGLYNFVWDWSTFINVKFFIEILRLIIFLLQLIMNLKLETLECQKSWLRHMILLKLKLERHILWPLKFSKIWNITKNQIFGVSDVSFINYKHLNILFSRQVLYFSILDILAMMAKM